MWGFFTPNFMVVGLGVTPKTNALNRRTQPLSSKNLTNNLRYLENRASLYGSLSITLNDRYG